MISIRRTDPEQVRKNWAAYREARKIVAPPRPRHNFQPAMEFGDITYRVFRGRAYGVPPLPWKRGEKLLKTWLDLEAISSPIKQNNLSQYYRLIGRLADLVWKSVTPVRPDLRLAWRLGLLRNPFRKATEGEIVEFALFLLGRRTTTHEHEPKSLNISPNGT